MRFLLYLKEIHTFTEDGKIPRQLWGDELQAVWFAKYLRKYGHTVDVFGEYDYSKSKVVRPNEPYDFTVYFEPSIPKYPHTKKHIFWHQSNRGNSNKYDFSLTVSSIVYEQLKEGGKVAYFLPAVDLEERFCTNTNRNIDVLFIGNYLVRTPDCYEKYLDPLLSLGLNIEIWGNGWHTEEKYSKFFKGKLPLNETNDKISSTKIYLNIHHNSHRENDVVIPRIFEGCACKSLVISDNIKYIKNLYPSDEVVTTTGGQHLINVVSYFLENEKERDFRANLGFKTTEIMHTWEHRVQQFLTLLNTHLLK